MIVYALPNRFGEVGRREEGLTAIEEAVTIRRRLAQGNPTAHEPNLAGSLWSMASMGVGEGSMRLGAVVEAVGIFGRLAAETPAAFAGCRVPRRGLGRTYSTGSGVPGRRKIRRGLTDGAPED